MARTNHPIDPKSGFCSETGTFHGLRPPHPLPPESLALSAASYAFSLRRRSPWPDPILLIDSATAHSLSYSEFAHRVQALAASFQTQFKLSKGDIAFVLAPNLIQLPILFFSLLSLGVVISPANPAGTKSEISRQVQLCNPVIAFAVSTAAHKLPTLRHELVLVDSPYFEAMMTRPSIELVSVEVSQSDLAAIMYSSGTTGPAKGVMLTHRNLIAAVGGYDAQRSTAGRASPAVLLYTVPYFHVYGFFFSVKSVAMAETAVVMDRFELTKMLKAVEDFGVTEIAVAPPVVVALVKSGVAEGCDLRSLESVVCGGAPLAAAAMRKFAAKFPGVALMQGYGMTESTGVAFRTVSREESLREGSAGRLLSNCEAKILQPDTGVTLPPCNSGELWIRGPMIMKGYIGDPEATAATLVDGWLRTGDLCRIDGDGFLFVEDRLKELIKYKGYQVSPAELEKLLVSHWEIVDAAVIPYPDEEAGEVPMAFVVRHPQSSLDQKQLMDHIATLVAPHKKIRRVSFVSSIPRSASGKLLRKELRKKINGVTGSRL